MIHPKVVLDARYAAAPLNGFGRYTWNLLEGLASIGPPEPIMILERQGQAKPRHLANVRGFTWRRVDHSPHSPWGQWALARRLAKAGATVMASPDVFAPFCPVPKQVVTLHDVIPLRCPELLNRSAKGRFSRLWRQWLRLQMRNADVVLTVSDHARQDIASAFGGISEKLRTVYNAVPIKHSSPGAPQDRSRGQVSLLYVGRTAPYKNVVGCIEALALLRCQGIDAGLTIVGEQDPRYPEVLQTIERLGLDHQVIIKGHVDDAALQDLYSRASVFIFLSRYEGFGLPPLEAMAHGVPVVASNRTSLPEVLGDAALLVNPDDPGAAAAAIRRLIEQPDLADMLSHRGRARAATFTLERQATMFWNAVSPLI